MYKLLILLTLFVTLSQAQTRGVMRSMRGARMDSSGTAPDSSFTYGKFDVWTKVGGDGTVGLFLTKGSGATNRIDTVKRAVDSVYRTSGGTTVTVHYTDGTTRTFTDSVGGGSGGSTDFPIRWGISYIGVADSSPVARINATATMDSVSAWYINTGGAVTATINVDKINTAGTAVKLFSSNYTLTTTMTKITTLQNTSLSAGDFLWLRIESLSAGFDHLYIEFYGH